MIKIIKSLRFQPFEGKQLINHVHLPTHHHEQRMCSTRNTHINLLCKVKSYVSPPSSIFAVKPILGLLRLVGDSRLNVNEDRGIWGSLSFINEAKLF